MLATGHPDARVRIWDTRTQGETLTRASLSSHKQWITDVKWAPGSETMVRCRFFGESYILLYVRIRGCPSGTRDQRER